MKYATVIDLLADKLKEAGIPYVLIGGLAVNAYEVTRQTADIDFLITSEDYPKISRLLQEEGYQEGNVSNVCGQLIGKSPFYWDVDFVFVDKDTLERIRKDAQKIKIVGKDFLIPSLKHLLALKLHALKNNAEGRMAKDWVDIISLIKQANMNVRSADFKELCLQYGTSDLYDKIIATLEGK